MCALKNGLASIVLLHKLYRGILCLRKVFFTLLHKIQLFFAGKFNEMFLCSCINCLTSHNIEFTCVYTTIIIEREFYTCAAR